MKTLERLLSLAPFLVVAPAFAGLPCAFSYGGRQFADIATESRLVLDDARCRKSVHEWRSPDGLLAVRTTETAYKRFPVTEYLPEIVCLGDRPTGLMEDFRSFSATRRASRAVLRALRGTVCTEKDFEPVTVTIGEKENGVAAAYSLVAAEGRSSAQWMPWKR